MPIWPNIAAEINALQKSPNQGLSAFDTVRHKYLDILFQQTGRNVIQYTSAGIHKQCDPFKSMVTPEDLHGFMTVINGLDKSKGLDLIIHSTGGSADVASATIRFLRNYTFTNIRVFVPHLALSAACLICLGCDEIWMGKHSALGPIDPQFTLNGAATPAHAIIAQFEEIEKKAQEAAKTNSPMMGFWSSFTRHYAPGLLTTCRNAKKLSEDIAKEWLEKHMFAGQTNARSKAATVAVYLADHKNFLSHGKHIFRDDARRIGLIIKDLESDEKVRDAVLSSHHAACITMQATPIVKIIENHNGVKYMT